MSVSHKGKVSIPFIVVTLRLKCVFLLNEHLFRQMSHCLIKDEEKNNLLIFVFTKTLSGDSLLLNSSLICKLLAELENKCDGTCSNNLRFSATFGEILL